MTRPQISFEFFPPQNFEGAYRLWDTVNTLAPLNPRFMSVTYGAGGTTRTLTQEATRVLHKHTGCDVAAHLTCVDATRDETLNIARSYADTGVTGWSPCAVIPPQKAAHFARIRMDFKTPLNWLEHWQIWMRFAYLLAPTPKPTQRPQMPHKTSTG